MKVIFNDPNVRQAMGHHWHITDGDIVVVFRQNGYHEWFGCGYLRTGTRDIDNKEIHSETWVQNYRERLEAHEGYAPEDQMVNAIFDTANHARVVEITDWWKANHETYVTTFEEELEI